MQGGSAASSFGSGSPAQHVAPAYAAPPLAAVPHSPPPRLSVVGTAPMQPPPAAAPPAAGFAGGSFSPSDASSIESSEADDVLGGLHNHLGRSLAAGAAAGMLVHSAHQGPPAGKGLHPSAAAAAGDADGIDDVLRMQPWLNE